MKVLTIFLFILGIIIGLFIGVFYNIDTKPATATQPIFDPTGDIYCGIHTQQGANYYLLGQSTKKADGLHLWFYPNGDKKLDEKNVQREIFAIEVILPGGLLWAK